MTEEQQKQLDIRQLISERKVDRRKLFQTAAAMGLTTSAAGAALLQVHQTYAQDIPREEALFIGGWQWGPPTTFSPFKPNPDWPVNVPLLYIFETLFGFNQLTGEIDPILGKELQWTDDQTAVVTLQDGTQFNDGTPLTSADVVYSFNLPKNNDGIYFSDFWDYVSTVEATDDRTITFGLNPERLNPGQFRRHLAYDFIVPKHIWETREGGEDPITEFVDLEPVASGPYKVLDSSTERVALIRDDNYWGATALGMPAPKYLVHPIFDSNDTANLAFSQGDLDLSQTFLPQIWQLWEDDGKPVGTWTPEEPFHLPGSIPLLFINVSRPPLDNPLVRRALAFSINYPQIAATAMSRYSVPANASLILPEGAEAKFFNAEQVAANGWTYDPERARAILEDELGATKVDDVYVLEDGSRLGPFTAHCPFGWTDWQTAIELVAQSANEAGFDVQTEFPEFPVVNAANQAGDFDLALYFIPGGDAGPATPWSRIRDVMDNRGVPPLGEPAFWNYNRYQNDAVSPLLDQAATADEETQKDLFDQLDAIYQQDIPAIPLMYRPSEFYEFHEIRWTGFATAENPTSPPTQRGAGVRLLYSLTPKTEG